MQLTGGLLSMLAFDGCTPGELPKSPTPRRTPTPTLPKIEGKEGLPSLTEREIQEAAAIVVEDYNRVLDLSLDQDEVKEQVVLVKELEEYQAILKRVEEGYEAGDELKRPAIATHERSPYGRKIFLYQKAIEAMTSRLPNNEKGRQARADFIRFVITHELGHWLGACYESEALHDLIFQKIFKKSFAGKNIKNGFVKGAEIKATVDGVEKAALQNLEEAEVVVISEFVIKNRADPKIVVPPSVEEFGIKTQHELLLDLLNKLNPDLNQSIKTLARLRMQEGGREKFCRLIGEKFNARPGDQLFFGLVVLLAIDYADIEIYQKHCGELNPPKSF